MPAARLSESAVVASAVVLLLLVATTAAILAPPPAQQDARGSSFDAGPEGAKAAYLVLKEMGFEVERTIEPLTSLALDPRTSVLVLASPTVAPSEQDRRALTRFLQRGGVVLATGTRGAEFLGGRVEAGPEDEEPAGYTPIAPSPLAVGAPGITMRREGGDVRLDSEYVAIYGPEHGPVVATRPVGDGRAIWWAASTPLSNGAIADAHNFDLLMNAIGTRAVYWDEHYHGHARSLWSYTARTPLRWMLAQALLVVAVALATLSRRRGPVRPRIVDARTSPMEFVNTLGGLYERAGATAACVAAAHTRLRRTLLSVCGLPPPSSVDAIARGAAARFGLAAEHVAAVLGDAESSARDQSLTPDAGLALVRRIQALSQQVKK